MNRYSIYCTPEQTRKALELGAPIELESEYYNPKENDVKLDNPIPCEHFTAGYHYAKCPTAEQMIGWLEGQGFYFRLNTSGCSVEIDFNCIIEKVNIPRREATLAAIDAALEYLISNKK